jgi:capsule polysaccharide export protein KpsE/RkpR
MTTELILIAAALVVLPTMARITQVLIDLLAKLIAAGFVFGLAMLTLFAIAAHARLA